MRTGLNVATGEAKPCLGKIAWRSIVGLDRMDNTTIIQASVAGELLE
jgi:hypothetical protein